MAEINEKINVMNKALAALKETLEVSKSYPSQDVVMTKIIRDSLIQRFEFSFDLFWKLLKFYLEDVQKSGVEISAPRWVMRECVKARVFSEDDAVIAMDMLNSRNMTSHTYREEIAVSEAAKIPAYYNLMYAITNRLKID